MKKTTLCLIILSIIVLIGGIYVFSDVKNNVANDVSIRIGTFHNSQFLTNEIEAFKKNNPGASVEITVYGEDDDPKKALMDDLRSENCPDIVDVPRNILYELVSEKLVEDLYPYIDNDKKLNREDFIPSVVKAHEINGGLYQSLSYVRINTWVTDYDELTDFDKWSMDSFEKWIRNNPEKNVFLYWDEEALTKLLISGFLPDYVDWQTSACSFQNVDFSGLIDILEYAKTHSLYQMSSDQDTEYGYVRSGELLFMLFDHDHLSAMDFLRAEKAFGRNASYVGPPLKTGSPTSFESDSDNGYQSYSIVSKSSNREAAWRFLRYFMSEDYQSELVGVFTDLGGFPVREDCYDAFMRQFISKKDFRYKGRLIPAEQWSDEYGAFDDEFAREYRELIDRTDRVQVYDDKLVDIVYDDLREYFFGKSSKEDAINDIQKRVSDYLAGQKEGAANDGNKDD